MDESNSEVPQTGNGSQANGEVKNIRDIFGGKTYEKKAHAMDLGARFKKVSSTLDELKFVNSQLKEEKAEKKLKKSAEPAFVPFTKLFRYATCSELTATWFGIFMGVATAWGLPLVIMIYGEFTQLMVERSIPGGEVSVTIILKYFGGGRFVPNATEEESADLLAEDSKAFGIASLVIAGTQFIAGVLSVHSLNWSAHRQIARIRLLFLKSVLRQDMAWYDTQPNLNFASKITDDLNKLNEGIGEKIGMFCYLIFSFLFSVSVAFAYGWKLTLVVMISAPVIIISAALVAKAQSSLTVKELNSYSHAGSAAEEVLSAIRTVIAFGGEDKEIQRYAERLEPANKAAVRRGLVTGMGGGIMWLIMYCSFALAFWYGVRLIQGDSDLPIEERTYSPGILIIVLWGIIGGAQNLGLCSPHTEAFAAARGAAHSVFELIARQPVIDSLSEEGEKPEKVTGDIKLTDVTFKYPSRPDVKVLQSLNLEIKAGETVALVGASGCGKSTVLQLLQRLYDPLGGKVELDGRNLPTLNVAWLRAQLGVVGQEPVLFSGTIRDNIAQGKPGCSDLEIQEAAIAANCHEFIIKLPFGYKTTIGERGAQLSGGQKQRIAIARSLIRNPKLLLLDEATSALDARGERRVQDALDKASIGRTTVMVTHRLVTVTSAHRIIFIDQGKVVEQGTHDELMALKGHYFKLVEADSHSQANDENKVEEDDEDNKILDGEESRRSVSRTQSIRETTPEYIRQMSRDSLRRAQKRSSISSVHSFGRSQRIQPVETTEAPEDDEAETEELEKSVSNWSLLKLNKPEWVYILFGSISSLIVGGVLPVFALLFSEVYGLLSLTDPEEITSGTALYCSLFVVVGILCGAGTFLQSYLFTEAGVRLTQRLRVMTFANFLKQEIGWYDDQKNSVGALCARLSGDAAAVQGATGMRIGTILQGISTLLIGVLMAFVFSWKMTLVSLVTIPLVLGGIYFEGRIIRNSQIKERKAMEGASKIATEAIMNIRTVHSMGAEVQFLDRYAEELNTASKEGGARSRLRGAVYSLGLTAPSFGYGISLYYGGLLIAYEGLPYKNVILVSEALIFGSWMLGQVLAFAPNFNGAKVSGARIVRLLARKPLIESDPNIVDDPKWQADGAIKYSNVEFQYPTRKNVKVLQGLDLEVLSGKTVALVGHSGCGKSTAIQLLQRLYEPSSGDITLDGKNISSGLVIPRLRCQLGLVSQEPTLFDRTIAENIAYGDNGRKVPTQEIIQAAIKTNIHGFISGLPLGYDTPLGAKGAQLSGGQKQRIAIARALVRNPRVLLLDEATSALDTQSEKLVQQALDAAKEGRTCITIAHRLSTIQNADLICVIDKGRIVEKGKHSELIAKKGLYADLQKMQAMATDTVTSRQTDTQNGNAHAE